MAITYTDVLNRLGGVYPTGITETMLTSWATQSEGVLNSFTHPVTLDATDSAVKSILIEIVLNMIEEKLWFHAGGALTGQARPVIITEELKARIKPMLTSTTYKGSTYLKMQATTY